MRELWRRRATTVATEMHAHLPLHMKRVPFCDYDRIIALECGERRERLTNLIRWNREAELYETVAQGKSANPGSRVSRNDIRCMLDAGFIEPTTRSSVRRVGKVFCVVEAEKARRRLIFWPRQLNEEVTAIKEAAGLDYLAPSLEDTLAAIADMTAPNLWATTADVKISFNQCLLAPAVRPYFAFHVGGEYFRLTRMPMGETVAPAVMQSITEAIAHAAARSLCVTTRVFVDNVRFLGDKTAVTAAMQRFQELSLECSLELNQEPGNVAHQAGTFLGMAFDYTNATVRLGQKAVNKLKAFRARILSDDVLIDEFMTGFGVVEYASRILRLQTSKFYVALKFARRRAAAVFAGQATPAMQADIWPCARPSLMQWIDELLANRPTPTGLPADKAREYVLATDASLYGWGAVLYCDATGEFHDVGGRWGKSHSHTEINELEAYAVANAWHAFATRLTELSKVQVLVDNTSVLHTARKGRAHEQPLNAAIDSLLSVIGGNTNVTIAYIDTKRNPADAVSRGLPVVKELASTLGSEGRRLEAKSVRVYAPAIPKRTEHLVSRK